MIIYKNVCDYCGSEEVINEDCSAFVVHFTILSAFEQEVKNRRHPMDANEISFCSKNCYCEWIKEHLRENGEFIDAD